MLLAVLGFAMLAFAMLAFAVLGFAMLHLAVFHLAMFLDPLAALHSTALLEPRRLAPPTGR
jgi:hypothetical protein